jgi:hypothetical protein
MDPNPLKINEKSHTFLPDSLRLPKNVGWGYVMLVVIGVSILVLIGYMVWIGNSTNNSIRFLPGDVIYGVKIHAFHDMGIDLNSRKTVSQGIDLNLAPEVHLSEQFYDFGVVNASQVLTRTFVIANDGKSPLIISRAYTTCGCTTADITSTEIPPGKVALITLQFDPGYHDLRSTTVRRGVMIETNDPNQPTQEIWIQASIR